MQPLVRNGPCNNLFVGDFFLILMLCTKQSAKCWRAVVKLCQHKFSKHFLLFQMLIISCCFVIDHCKRKYFFFREISMIVWVCYIKIWLPCIPGVKIWFYWMFLSVESSKPHPRNELSFRYFNFSSAWFLLTYSFHLI